MSESEKLIAMELAALERWCRGDPSGFLEIYDPEIVYFDPFIPHRIDGLPAVSLYYEGLRGKIFAERCELVDPVVCLAGDCALLAFHFVSWDRDNRDHRWNCTEAYRTTAAGWRIVQSHWSLTQKQP